MPQLIPSSSNDLNNSRLACSSAYSHCYCCSVSFSFAWSWCRWLSYEFATSLHSSRLRVLSFLFCGSNERELSLWPWRIVFASNFVGSIVTMYFATDEHMADLYYLHLFNTMVQVCPPLSPGPTCQLFTCLISIRWNFPLDW